MHARRLWLRICTSLTSFALLAALVLSAPGSAHAATQRVARPSGPIYYRNEAIVLMYHEVDYRKLPGDFITPGTFAQELKLFKADNYHIITLDQLIAFLRHRGQLPPNAVLITFDNGYRSFYRTAFPLLKKYHDPATLFMIVHWLDSKGPDAIHRLTWPELRSMYKTGLLDVQSQTYNMHKGVEIAPGESSPATVALQYNPATGHRETLAQYKRRVLADLVRARVELMRGLHEKTVDALSYPFGDYDPLLIHLLHEAGYKYMFTAEIGWGVLRTTNTATLYRLNSGAPDVTPQDLMSTIRYIGQLTWTDPSWKPAKQFIQVWHW
jgi:biofilm PGA synthesis lipoprotein PgaB